jgi:formate dehydrogenase iron-sulfur subunit
MSDSIHFEPLPASAPAECPLISRRNFLKGMAAGAGALAVTAAAGGVALASSGPADANAWGMLVDLTRCTGCDSCALACKGANDRADQAAIPTKIDADAYSFVDRREVQDLHGAPLEVFVKRQCMHCVDPACVSACTVGALRKTPEGPVVYDASKCIGCRYCQYACPYGVPAYDWDNPLGLIGKCEMCADRVEDGNKPACAAACPNGAIKFGKRSMLLAEAKATLRSNPGRYIDHIYGEHEAGGTSVLYIGPVPFSALGFPVLGDETITHYGESVMRKTPVVALTMASLAAAIQFMTGRRAKHAHTEFATVEASAPTASGDKS